MKREHLRSSFSKMSAVLSPYTAGSEAHFKIAAETERNQ
jgi:hypothetical protein